MKTAFLITSLLLSATWAKAQADSASTPMTVFTVVEQPPAFPGGMAKLSTYLRQNLRYPEAAQKAGIKGRSFVKFLVADTGEIKDVQLIKSLSPELDAEAIRVVSEMPRWSPGRQNGRPVNVAYNLPINFP
ncbi:energy transducer TonB [Spirosoma fluminis]